MHGGDVKTENAIVSAASAQQVGRLVHAWDVPRVCVPLMAMHTLRSLVPPALPTTPPACLLLQLLDAVAAGDTAAIGASIATCARSGRALPVSPAAMLVAAVKLQQPAVAALLLEDGAPVSFACSQLGPADRAALTDGGCSVDGMGHLCPLSIAVRQQNLEVCRLLLRHGAPAGCAADGEPLLLHYLDAVAAAAGSRPASAAGASSSGSAAGSVCGGGGSHGGGGGGGRSPAVVRELLISLENRLQLLQLLLSAGSCPFQPSSGPLADRSFLSGAPLPPFACRLAWLAPRRLLRRACLPALTA